MAFGTIVNFNVMGGNIDLGNHLQRPGCVDAMTSSAELPPALLQDIVRTGILRMLQTGSVTDQARKSGMKVIIQHGLDIVMTIIAGLFACMDKLLRCYIFKGICPVMSVFPETFRDQEMTDYEKYANEDDEDGNESF